MKCSCHLLLGFLVLLLGGCGTTVHESLKVQTATMSKIGADKTVVILPFSDYSNTDNLETTYRRNLFVSENLTDQFRKYSFRSPVQEDVFLYLVDQNIINIVPLDNKAKSLERELNHDWSNQMKEELQHYITLSRNYGSNSSAGDNLGTHGLTQQEVVKIGRHFSADYIVRGSIIQYKDRLYSSSDPLKQGIVPFVLGVNNKILFGQADSAEYDELGYMIAGGMTGALISGVTNGDAANVVTWGVIGAGLGAMASHSGKVPQAVVQLRVWVQDAYTGNVVWTNRVDVKVAPKSIFADYQYDALFESATEKAIATLIEDFSKTM